MPADIVINKYSGEILATEVTFEEYLERFGGMHCELVDGNVIKPLSPSIGHQDLKLYLFALLKAYFDLKPLGTVILQPFVQKLNPFSSVREPDLLVLLNINRTRLKDTYLDGPADICVEIISSGSEAIDRGKKFLEYEVGGVQEYWLFDPLRSEALFYRLNSDGLYEPQPIDARTNYRSSLLPDLVIHVPTLWKVPLPGTGAIVRSVEAMLK